MESLHASVVPERKDFSLSKIIQHIPPPPPPPPPPTGPRHNTLCSCIPPPLAVGGGGGTLSNPQIRLL